MLPFFIFVYFKNMFKLCLILKFNVQLILFIQCIYVKNLDMDIYLSHNYLFHLKTLFRILLFSVLF